MIEPTESENLEEIDKFCNALIKIKKEIDFVETGKFDKEDNPLKNAPKLPLLRALSPLRTLLTTHYSLVDFSSFSVNHEATRSPAARPLAAAASTGATWPPPSVCPPRK